MQQYQQIVFFILTLFFVGFPANALECNGIIRDSYGDTSEDYINVEPLGITVDQAGTVYTLGTEVYDDYNYFSQYVIRKGTNGKNWSTVFTSGGDAGYSGDILIDSKGRVFAIGAFWDETGQKMDYKLWRSVDKGQSWSVVKLNFLDGIRELALGQNNEIYLVGLSESSKLTVYASHDQADSWSKIYLGENQVETAKIKVRGSTIAVTYSTYEGEDLVAISKNDGKSWKNYSNIGYNATPIILDSGTLYLMSGEGGGDVQARMLRIDKFIEEKQEWKHYFRLMPQGYYYNEDSIISSDGYVYSVGRGANDGLAIRKSNLDFSQTAFVEDMHGGVGSGGIALDPDGGFWTFGLNFYGGDMVTKYFPNGCQ